MVRATAGAEAAAVAAAGAVAGERVGAERAEGTGATGAEAALAGAVVVVAVGAGRFASRVSEDGQEERLEQSTLGISESSCGRSGGGYVER